MIDIIKEFHLNDLNVLEIGCAPGKYLKLFNDFGCKISGLEYSSVGITAVKKNFQIFEFGEIRDNYR